jgi:hypothetical protein
MTEWLDLMLEEIRRKNEEQAEAMAESERRDAANPQARAKTKRDKLDKPAAG